MENGTTTLEESIKLSEKQKELIERLGVINEKLGSSPAAARIQSLLVVSDETSLTFDQVRQALNLSKSATSNALNFLLRADKIEYITKLGDRKRYFRTLLHRWEDQLIEQNKGIKYMSDTLQEVLKERTGETIEFNGHLKEVIDFLEFYRETVRDTFEKWKANK